MNNFTINVGSVYLTKNNIKVTITAKTLSGFLGTLPASSISSVTSLEYLPDGRAVSYYNINNDNDNQGDYDIVQYLPYG